MRTLNIIDNGASPDTTSARVLRPYPLATRLYGRVRFQILSPRFLEAIEQHLPESGTVADIGCGFGLFTLYFAARHPRCNFIGLDLNRKRIFQARAATLELGLSNVRFECRDATGVSLPDNLSAAITIDLLHHMPPVAGHELITNIHARLSPGGTYLLKEIDTRARSKLFFTYVLDCVVSPDDDYYYRSEKVWREVLKETGFEGLHSYPLTNYIPFPHFLMIARKPH